MSGTHRLDDDHTALTTWQRQDPHRRGPRVAKEMIQSPISKLFERGWRSKLVRGGPKRQRGKGTPEKVTHPHHRLCFLSLSRTATAARPRSTSGTHHMLEEGGLGAQLDASTLRIRT